MSQPRLYVYSVKRAEETVVAVCEGGGVTELLQVFLYVRVRPYVDAPSQVVIARVSPD